MSTRGTIAIASPLFGSRGSSFANREHPSHMGIGEGSSRRLSDDPRSRSRADEPEAADSPRVVIADDHPFFRSSVARLLRENGIEVAAEVGSGEAAIDAVAEMAPQIVVMDLKMPGVSGLEATRRLTDAYPATHVVVLSISASEKDVIDSVLAGANGYVLKDAPPDELLAAIRAAAAGEPLVSPRIAEALLRRIREAIGTGEGLAGTSLSGRELQILDGLAAGRRSAEIGGELGLEEHEVREYTSSLLMKLRVDSAVRTALRDVDAPDT
jgi:two-component system nitrate/nitrite response regulator NarL